MGTGKSFWENFAEAADTVCHVPWALGNQQLCQDVPYDTQSPFRSLLTPDAQEKMKKIEQCLHCNQCKGKCPYNLDTPALLEKNLKDYQEILDGKEY